MPGEPKQCRLNAIRYLTLAEHATNPERRQKLAELAETWAKLAAENESEQALLLTLSELEFDEPSYALPEALNLRVPLRRSA
jgi:hypothetical protein